MYSTSNRCDPGSCAAHAGGNCADFVALARVPLSFRIPHNRLHPARHPEQCLPCHHHTPQFKSVFVAIPHRHYAGILTPGRAAEAAHGRHPMHLAAVRSASRHRCSPAMYAEIILVNQAPQPHSSEASIPTIRTEDRIRRIAPHICLHVREGIYHVVREHWAPRSQALLSCRFAGRFQDLAQVARTRWGLELICVVDPCGLPVERFVTYLTCP